MALVVVGASFAAIRRLHGGLRPCDHRRRPERCQPRARCRRPRPAGHPVGAGRSGRRGVLGNTAADPRRSLGAGTARLPTGAPGARRAPDLAPDRAASGSADALRDPGAFRRAPAMAAAPRPAPLRQPHQPERPACNGDPRHHASSGRQRAETSIRHGLRIFGLRRRRFPTGGAHGTGCGRARRRDSDWSALCARRSNRHMAARGGRPRPSSHDHGPGIGQRHGGPGVAGCGSLGGAAAARLGGRGGRPHPAIAAMQMRQIIVLHLFDSHNVYVFQNSHGRLIFASPLDRDFTLIGTITHDFTGDPAIVAMRGADVGYLCEAASRYFRERVAPTDVVRAVSGVNLTLASARRRDGTTLFHARRRKAPLITMFGGDVTTSRLRAERAVTKLTPFYPMSPPWTAGAALPGGDFAWDRFDTEVDLARDRWRFLSEPQAERLVRSYGSRLPAVLGEAKTRDDLGPAFGPELTGAEVRYLMTHEWARFPEDILWRRSKLGLTMSAQECDALAAFMANA